MNKKQTIIILAAMLIMGTTAIALKQENIMVISYLIGGKIEASNITQNNIPVICEGYNVNEISNGTDTYINYSTETSGVTECGN